MNLTFRKLFHIRYIPIYLVFLFYLIVSFGAGVGANYTYAPYLLISSLICISAYNTNRNSIKNNPILMILQYMIILVFLFSWNFINFKYTVGNYFEYLSYSLLPFITCFAFYKFASSGRKEFNLTLLIFIIFYIVALIRFFHEKEAMLMNGYSYGNNNFYMLVMPLPILFILPNRVLRFIPMFLSSLLCMLSLKRSAMICAIIIPSIFFWYELKKGIKSKIAIIILIIISAIILFNFTDMGEFYKSYDRQMERFERLSKDGGSGRTDIIDDFFEKDISDVMVVLGKGFMGYHNKYPDLIASHNDVIELYYSYGIIGLIVFFLFAFNFIKTGLFAIKTKSRLALSYSVAITLLILYSLVSGLFTFVNLSLTFFSFIGISQAYPLVFNEKRHSICN